MRVNKIGIFLLLVFFVSCSTSPEIQASQTSLELSPTPMPTHTPFPTPTITPSPTPINLDSIINPIIRDAYSYYIDNKEELILNLPNRTTMYDMIPHKGIYWPFLVYEPSEIKSRNILVIIPNTGNPNYDDDDRFITHFQAAIGALTSARTEAEYIGSVLLVPVFPRFSIPHTFGAQYLSQYVLQTDILELKDVDLQLLSMADSIINEYRAGGINLSDKLLFTGYSAQSWFSSRFTALNPSRVQAVSIGGCAWSTVPASSYLEFNLPFPLGLGNIEEYGREIPALEEYQDVHMYIYWGTQDGFNEGYGWDFGPITDGYSLLDKKNPNKNFFKQFGQNAEDLFISNKEIFKSLNIDNIQFVLLQGLNHSQVYQQNYQNAVDFLKEHAEYIE